MRVATIPASCKGGRVVRERKPRHSLYISGSVFTETRDGVEYAVQFSEGKTVRIGRVIADASPKEDKQISRFEAIQKRHPGYYSVGRVFLPGEGVYSENRVTRVLLIRMNRTPKNQFFKYK